jgi:ParB/RepB/Spo0J family partition protein
MKVPIDHIKVPTERTRSVIDIDSDEMRELAESIRAVGLINPITVDRYWNLIAGERRLIACRMAGLEEVEIRVSEADSLQVELEENTKRLALPWPDRARAEVRLYDQMKERLPKWTQAQQANLTGKATSTVWTFLRLGRALATRPHLEALPNPTEAERLLDQEEEREKEGPGLPAHIVHAPEWAQDRYVVGDAFVGLQELMNSQPQQRGVACHLAFVDPPRRRAYEEARISPEYWVAESFDILYKMAAERVYECMMPNSFGLFWFEMEEGPTILRILRNSGWEVSPTPGIWVYSQISATPKPDTLLGTCFEPFYIARKGRPRLGRPGRGNVFNYPDATKIARHEKPYLLCQEIVKTFLFPQSRVIIPFLGSGNMLRAATAAGHMAFGWDVVPLYKERFLKRVEEDRTKFEERQRRLGNGV